MHRTFENDTIMNHPEDIILFGGGDLCRQILGMIAESDLYRVQAIVDAAIPDTINGIPVYKDEAEIQNINIRKGFIAIGDSGVREKVAGRILELYPDFIFVNIIGKQVYLSQDVSLGQGVCIMSGSVIQNGTVIGSHVIMSSGVIIEHDNWVSDFCSFGPGACTGGNVKIGHGAIVAIRAVILHGRRIGKYAILGAQALLTEDLAEGFVAVGIPAKPIRKRDVKDPYL